MRIKLEAGHFPAINVIDGTLAQQSQIIRHIQTYPILKYIAASWNAHLLVLKEHIEQAANRCLNRLMLLSIKYKFLFVHIAKTGGTSVRDSLWRYKWTDPYRIPQFLCSKLSAFTGHKIGAKFPRHAKAIAAMEMLPREFYQSLFKFTFVRNPWDLQVSSWHHLLRERPHLVEAYPDFESFLRWKLDPARPPQYHADMSIELQSDYIIDLQGNLIVDFIGRYESLAEDFEEACRRIGVATPKLLHSRKAERGKDYRSYYTDASAEWVKQHYRADIEHFGYAFDGPL